MASVQLESDFKKKVLVALKALPGCWFVKTQQVSIRGTPDILACVRGRFVALELKRSAEAKIDVLQTYNIEGIRKAGGYGAVVSPENWLDVLGQLRAI